MTTIKVISIIALGLVLFRIVKSNIKYKVHGHKIYDRNQYCLILGEDATEIFKRYDVNNMHGLSLDKAISRIAQGGTYIDGLSNYHPEDKDMNLKPKPFLFLNMYSIQNNYSNERIPTLVMHECMHMANMLWSYRTDSHEEEMITWAENEANEIVKLLKKEKHI